MLNDHAFPHIRSRAGRRQWWFQQDGATAHCTTENIAVLQVALQGQGELQLLGQVAAQIRTLETFGFGETARKKFARRVVTVMKAGVLIIVIAWGWAVGLGGAVDFADVIKSWHSPARQRVVERLLNRDAYRGVNASLRRLLAAGNLSELGRPEAAALPQDFWDKLGAGAIATLPKGARDYVNSKISERTKFELGVLLSVAETNAEVVPKLKNLLPAAKPTSVEVLLLLEELGDPRSWNKEKIKDMKTVLFYLPISMLTQVENAYAISEIHEELLRCSGSGPGTKSTSCPTDPGEARGEGPGPRARYMASLNYWLHEKIFSAPSEWSLGVFKAMNLNALPPLLLARIGDANFFARQDAILTTLQGSQHRRQVVGRAVVQRILRDARKEELDLAEMKDRLRQLETHYLAPYVYITDLPDEVLDADDGAFRKDLEGFAAAAVQEGTVDGEVLEEFTKEFAWREEFSAADVDRFGPSLMAMAPGSTLNATLEKLDLSEDQILKLITAVRNTAGVCSRGKLLQIKEKIFSKTGNEEYLLNQEDLPDDLLGILPLRYVGSSFTKRLDLLRRNVSLPTALLVGLVSQLSSVSVKSLPPGMVEAVAVTVLKLLPKDDVISLAAAAPPHSKVGLLASQLEFRGNPVSLASAGKRASLLTGEDARRVREPAVLSELGAIQNASPTHPACKVLQQKLVTYLQWELGAEGEGEVASLLTPTDVVLMPACVSAAFGAGVVRGFPPRVKLALLGKLLESKDDVLRAHSISGHVLEVILEEGLRARGRLTDLTGAEAEELGGLLLYTPASTIASVSEEAACIVLRHLDELGTKGLLPCVGSSRRGAVGELFSKCLGDDPQQWTQLRGLCCLLRLLPLDRLRLAPAGALAACRCPQPPILGPNAGEAECRRRLGRDYDSLLQQEKDLLYLQQQAALSLLSSGGRRRRTTDVQTCDAAATSGADALSEEALRDTPSRQVVACLFALGARPLPRAKAEILLAKVLETLNPRVLASLNGSLIRDSGHILTGIRAQDVYALPSLKHPEFDDAVATFGREDIPFSEDQLDELAAKVLGSWVPLSSLSAVQLGALNRLVCAFNSTHINALSTTALKSVLGTFGRTLQGCDREKVLTPLAQRAKSIYSIPMSRAEVHEMGVLVGGLSPSEVKALPPSSVVGLTPLAVRTMSAQAVEAMTPEQLRNLQEDTAEALQDAYWGNLSPPQQGGLSEALIDCSAAPCAPEASGAIILAAIFLLATH